MHLEWTEVRTRSFCWYDVQIFKVYKSYYTVTLCYVFEDCKWFALKIFGIFHNDFMRLNGLSEIKSKAKKNPLYSFFTLLNMLTYAGKNSLQIRLLVFQSSLNSNFQISRGYLCLCNIWLYMLLSKYTCFWYLNIILQP